MSREKREKLILSKGCMILLHCLDPVLINFKFPKLDSSYFSYLQMSL